MQWSLMQEPHAMEPHAMEPHAMESHAMEPHAMEPHAMEPHIQGRQTRQNSEGVADLTKGGLQFFFFMR